MSSLFAVGHSADDDRRYVDLNTFRRMFGLSRSGVYRLVEAGVLTRLKLGGRSRFIVAEGEAYMRSLPTERRRR
jgi:predicted DNA-binding transcriptional regulator AlpA